MICSGDNAKFKKLESIRNQIIDLNEGGENDDIDKILKELTPMFNGPTLLAFVCPETVYYMNTKCTKFKLYLFWSGDVQAILVKDYFHFQDLTGDYLIDKNQTLPFQYQEHVVEPSDILLLLGGGLLSIKENSFVLDHLSDSLTELPDSNLLTTLATYVYDANIHPCAKLCSIAFKNVWNYHVEESLEDVEIHENDVQNEEDRHMENEQIAEIPENVESEVPFPIADNLRYEYHSTPPSDDEDDINPNLIENDKKK